MTRRTGTMAMLAAMMSVGIGPFPMIDEPEYQPTPDELKQQALLSKTKIVRAEAKRQRKAKKRMKADK